MEKPILYRRFADTYNESSLADFFQMLIKEGLEIIYYDEQKMANGNIYVTVVTCKKQSNIL